MKENFKVIFFHISIFCCNKHHSYIKIHGERLCVNLFFEKMLNMSSSNIVPIFFVSALVLVILGICSFNGHLQFLMRKKIIDKMSDYPSYCKYTGISLMLYGFSLVVLGFVFAFNLFDMFIFFFMFLVWVIIAIAFMILAGIKYCDR